MSRKLFIYEINEVPWRVIDLYVKLKPNSTLGELIKSSASYTTHTEDTGELHPWSTWPTVHRGVANDIHGIQSLNQDLSVAKNYPPLWEILSENGTTVGICGSLQSYPPIQHENILFHIPDTFSNGVETIPSKYKKFQNFNLKQTESNSGQASTFRIQDIVSAATLFTAGIKIKTYWKIFKHLLNERNNSLHKTRRPLLQAHLTFDLLQDSLKKQQPDLVTFFSNHVAGIMHRYWKYSFPEDFDYELKTTSDFFHKESLMVAMDIFDQHLRVLNKYCLDNDYTLIFCSSMGQQAIDRGKALIEPRLESLDMLLNAIDFQRPIERHLAMYPDLALSFDSNDDLNCFLEKSNDLIYSDGSQVLNKTYNPQGLTLSMRVSPAKSTELAKTILFRNKEFSNVMCGFSNMERDIGTGYHQPKGILIWTNMPQDASERRRVVDSRRVLPTILNHFNIPISNYMLNPIKLEI